MFNNKQRMDDWTVSEIFLDLLQDKLLNFQKFYDQSVLERDALRKHDVNELLSILQGKSELQQQVNHLDKQIHQLRLNNPEFITEMNEEQNAEFKDTINLMVELLQKIIDYEARNREIAIAAKSAIQQDLNQLRTGNKILKSYFSSKQTRHARFLDKTH